MKKRHLFWIIPSALITLILLLYVILKLISAFHPLSEPFVNRTKHKTTLTEKELNRDLDYIKHYMSTCYAGYDDMVEKGFNLDSAIENIYNNTKKEMHNGVVASSVLITNTVKELLEKNPLIDGHFGISGTYRNPYKLYFSDLYFEEKQTTTETKYFLTKIQREEIDKEESFLKKKVPLTELPLNLEYTGSTQNLYKWFDGNKIIYRYGVFTNKEIHFAYIDLNNNKEKIPVYYFDRLESKTKNQSYKETNKTLYLSLQDFVFDNGSDIYEFHGQKEFQNLLNIANEKSRNKENIILDLRSNGGGEPIRLALLFANILYENYDFDTLNQIFLYDDENSNAIVSSTIAKARLHSIFYDIKDFFKKLKFRNKKEKFEYEEYYDSIYKKQNKIRNKQILPQLFFPSRKMITLEPQMEDKPLPPTKFSGTIYILTDRYSASCSEYTMGVAYKLAEKLDFNVVHLGDNSNGAVYYVNPRSFVTPYSGLWFYMPTKKTVSRIFDHPNFKGEGLGWHPEYWVTKYNLANTLTNLINDPELPQMLVGLEKNHL